MKCFSPDNFQESDPQTRPVTKGCEIANKMDQGDFGVSKTVLRDCLGTIL